MKIGVHALVLAGLTGQLQEPIGLLSKSEANVAMPSIGASVLGLFFFDLKLNDNGDDKAASVVPRLESIHDSFVKSRLHRRQPSC